MAQTDGFEQLVYKFQELWLEACRARLERLAESWEPWIRAMLTEPLPEDWQGEIDRFVENTRRSIGLIIAPDSVGQIENLIRDRAGGTGVFTAVGPAPVQGEEPPVEIGKRVAVAVLRSPTAVGLMAKSPAVQPICFAAGTPFLTAEGFKPIELIARGERLLAPFDTEPQGAASHHLVEAVYHHPPRPLINVGLGEHVIRCTPRHPFYVVHRGWVAAEELVAGDALLSPSGEIVRMTDVLDNGDVEPVFNLHVADARTYFVATRDGKQVVLVHNQSGGSPQGPRQLGSIRVDGNNKVFENNWIGQDDFIGILSTDGKSVTRTTNKHTQSVPIGQVQAEASSWLGYDKDRWDRFFNAKWQERHRKPLGRGGAIPPPAGGGGNSPANKKSNQPNTAIEEHHQLPREFKGKFEKAGLDIKDFKIPLEKGAHRLKPDGVHTGTENWNAQWRRFFDAYPDASRQQILDQLARMRKAFGLE